MFVVTGNIIEPRRLSLESVVVVLRQRVLCIADFVITALVKRVIRHVRLARDGQAGIVAGSPRHNHFDRLGE